MEVGGVGGPELPLPRFQAGAGAEQQVDRAGHGAENAFPGRTALQVGEVGVQRLVEERP
jgi:hypothetical protein